MKHFFSSETSRLAVAICISIAGVAILFFGLQAIFHTAEPFVNTIKDNTRFSETAFFYRH